MLFRIHLFIVLILSTVASVKAVDTHQADVVVYGDASGGVTAAVQAARMGKKVILVSQYGHLGGLSSSGLGWTDIGNNAILGGLSREFYHAAYKHYENDSAWQHEAKDKYGNKRQGKGLALDPKTELASTFEPKVAEAIFDTMIKKAGVKVIKGRLDLKNGAEKAGTRITTIKLEGGTTITAKMFIDASYEGDLLAAAGVSYMIGREANAEYGESGNGITGALPQNQMRKGIDPYVVKGDPASGLLPGVNPDMGGEVGDADHRLQAYCYRMTLTDVEANRVKVTKPANYKEAGYELLFRSIEKGQQYGYFKTSMLPNRKTDSNNTGGISTDLIGGNYGKDWNWATLNHKEREALAAKHRDWQLGLIWTLQNHPRVPEKIRIAYGKWGLAKDEYTDNSNWPYNLYVREARRMKSAVVMTEAHCKNKIAVEDPVGMGAYTLDSHNTQRFVQNGMVKNEGDIQRSLGGKPYGISYRSIIPKANECENLLVPWALSSTHIAFGSIRMEPVFMVLGQSAGTAASMAIDSNSSVQDIPYKALRERLIKDDIRLPHRERDKTGVLSPDSIKVYVDRFNQNDQTHFGQAISNEETAEWMAKSVPRFECPDKEMEEIYHFRWWTFRKHIKQTPDGFVITEFLPKVSWSGKHNTISCPAGHHFREARWISDNKYLDDYATFWFRKGGSPRRYSFWAADAVYQHAIAKGDFTMASELLPDLIANYKEWEKAKLDPDGLFWQKDDRDGMEVSIGGSAHRGLGKRPTINSYMYGDALAISAIAERANKPEIAKIYSDKAAKIKQLVLAKLWDEKAEFFKVLPRDEGAKLVDVREQHGYTPWYFNLPTKGKGYEVAWKQLMDKKGFYAPFGPTVAEQRHPKFSVSYEGHECQWNGPSWPFATTVTLTALANVLHDYPQDSISRQDYFDTLKIYTKSHRLKGEDGKVVPWIDENLNPYTGDWIARTRLKSWKNGTWDKGKGGIERGKDYNHSAYCDLIITGLIGLRPRADGIVEVNPLLPADTWDYFCLDQVPYHDRMLTILYDKTGKKYGKGSGLRILADGKEIASSPVIKRLTAPLPQK